MDETEESSFDGLAKFKKSTFYGKRSSCPSSVLKDPNDIFNVFRGALGTLNEMKVEEREQFYEPIEEKPNLENIVQDELHLPDLQDRLVISNVETTAKYDVNGQVRSPRRRSVPTYKKSPRDVPIITVESNAPSTQFWTHPASPPEPDMTPNTTSLSLPQIDRTTNGSKSAYAKSCIDGPQKFNTRLETMAKKGRRSNSLIFPYRQTAFGKSLQAKWCGNGTGKRRHSSYHYKARSQSWKLQLHERKQPHFTS